MKKVTAEEWVELLEYAMKNNVSLLVASERLFPDED